MLQHIPEVTDNADITCVSNDTDMDLSTTRVSSIIGNKNNHLHGYRSILHAVMMHHITNVADINHLHKYNSNLHDITYFNS